VTIPLSSSDTTEGTVSPSSLTFTSANWSTEQTVTVTGVDDDLEDGHQSYTIVLGNATSADPDYDGMDPDDISVTNVDDDGGSNNPPSVPELVSPSDGATGLATTVTFMWNECTDYDGDDLTYELHISEYADFYDSRVINVASASSGVAYAGAGLVFMGIVFAGVAGGRKRTALLLVMLVIAASLLFSACGDGNNKSSDGDAAPVADITCDVSGLEAEATYYWKVTVSDGTDTTESETWTFSTESETE
jgi:hypothetical protein